jgi:large subunit ribosomal protein L13e
VVVVAQHRHFKKDWHQRYKVTLDQAKRKLKRRLLRKKKAEAIAPRPVSGLLRPAVHCPTQKYNSKVRAGRGFTLAELKAAKVSAAQARSIGIAVDHRRRNHCQESLALNVARLGEYKSKLIVFPRKSNKAKKGDASKADLKAATQLQGPVLPIVKVQPKLVKMAITEEMKKHGARKQAKLAVAKKYIEGKRRWAKEVDEEANAMPEGAKVEEVA